MFIDKRFAFGKHYYKIQYTLLRNVYILTLAVIGTLLILLTLSQRKYEINKYEINTAAFIILSALALLTLLNSDGKKGAGQYYYFHVTFQHPSSPLL